MKPGRDTQRLLSKVNKTDTCWLFEGAKVGRYGSFRFEGKSYLAHRAAYILLVGQIPQGMHVCHRCDIRNRVRPEHLFIGTRSDNMKDCATKGRNFSPRHNLIKTHCPSGHPYSGKNLILEKTGWRRCRTCTNKNQNARRNQE